jgi:RNA polymerase sigma factor (sigma-70 family)
MSQVEGALLLRRIRKLAGEAPGLSTDSQLVQQFVAQRDETAFTAFVRRHASMVLRVCRGVLHHQQDAEDACQAAFLVLARKAHTIGNHEAIGGWLYRVAYRVAAKARVQAQRRQDREQMPIGPVSTIAADDLTLRESQAILHEELHCLPEKYRAPLLLCYWEGKTRDEAAEQLGTTVDAFKKRLERARKLLESRLTRRGFVPSAGYFTTLLLSNDAALAVSGAFTTKISQTAIGFAAGNKAAAAVTAVALAEGVIRTMSTTKWATTLLALVFVGALGTGVGYQAVQSKQPDGPDVVPSKQPDVPSNALAAVAAEQQPANEKDKEKPATPKGDVNPGEAYKIQKLDVLFVRGTSVQRDKPIAGPYAVDPEGKIDLGFPYNNGASILVVDLTHDDAKKHIEEILRKDFKDAHVELTLPTRRVLDFQKIDIDNRLALLGRAKAEGKNEDTLREIIRILRDTAALDESLPPWQQASEISSTEYIQVLKLHLKVIDLQANRVQEALDKDRSAAPNLHRTAKDFPALDERCKRLRRDISRWNDRMQDLELEFALEAKKRGLPQSVGTQQGAASQPPAAEAPVPPSQPEPGEIKHELAPVEARCFRVLELRPDANGEVRVPVLGDTAQKIIINHQLQLSALLSKLGEAHPDVQALRNRIERIAKALASNQGPIELGKLKDLRVTTATGKEVSKEDALKKLANGGTVVVSINGKQVPPADLKVFKDDVLVLISPDLAVRGFGVAFGYGNGAAPTDIKLDEIPRAGQLAAAEEAFVKRGIKYSYQGNGHFELSTETTDADLKSLPNLPFRFGLTISSDKVTGAGFKVLKGLTNLKELDLYGPTPVDAYSNELKELKNLTKLGLFDTDVSDACLKELKALENLTNLDLTGTKVTDAGLKEIKELKNLTSLDLSMTKVTNAGLKELTELKNLTRLSLTGTRVTNATLKALREALPNCNIEK